MTAERYSRLVVTEMMIMIGLPLRVADDEEGDEGGNDVDRRFQPVRQSATDPVTHQPPASAP